MAQENRLARFITILILIIITVFHFSYAQNNPPTHDNPYITPPTPNDNSNLTCNWNNVQDSDNDSVVNITNWYKNNISISLLYLPFEGGSNSTFTKDYSGYNNSGIPLQNQCPARKCPAISPATASLPLPSSI